MSFIKYLFVSLFILNTATSFGMSIDHSHLPQAIKDIYKTQFWVTDIQEYEAQGGSTLFGEAQFFLQGLPVRVWYLYLVDGSQIDYFVPAKNETLTSQEISPDFSLFQYPLNKCLHTHLKLKEFKAEISLVRTQEIDCEIPSQKKGTFIMHLAEALIQSHKIKNAWLQDAAKVTCPKSQEGEISRARLSLLRLVEKGESWYQNFGFQPTELNLEMFFSQKSKFLSIPLSSVKSTLFIYQRLPFSENEQEKQTREDFLKHCSRALGIFQQLVDEFVSERPIHAETLGSFLLWVWNHHCEHYGLISRLLFRDTFLLESETDNCSLLSPEINEFKEWADPYHELIESLRFMEKTYSYEN